MNCCWIAGVCVSDVYGYIINMTYLHAYILDVMDSRDDWNIQGVRIVTEFKKIHDTPNRNIWCCNYLWMNLFVLFFFIRLFNYGSLHKLGSFSIVFSGIKLFVRWLKFHRNLILSVENKSSWLGAEEEKSQRRVMPYDINGPKRIRADDVYYWFHEIS